MARLRMRLFLTLVAVSAVACGSLLSYRLGYSQGVEAGYATASEVMEVAHGVSALITIRNLEAGRRDEALSGLDAAVDAGISAHWLRLKAPSHYADYVPPSTELVAYLEQYRRSRPSAARSQTPTMNRMVAEYLEHQDQD